MLSSDLNPMMRQYWDLKARYQNCLLFFRLGDFYEMFFDDAERASRLLGLTLTSRGSGKDARAPMCGVPYQNAQAYIARLLKMGEKVAICEQMEDPRKTKGLVRRDVVRVLTPGTVVESDLLAERMNNYLTAVLRIASGYGIASVDLSTGDFMAAECSGADSLEEIRDEILRLKPAEVLATKDVLDSLRLPGVHSTAMDDPPSAAEARDRLLRHFEVASLAGFGCEEYPGAQRAAAMLLDYLTGTHKGGAAHLKTLTTYTTGSFLRLDPFTLDALEVVDGRDEKATLLAVLDLTVGASGARTLRQWLVRPLVLAGDILDRQDAVEWFVDHAAERAALRDLLKSCSDLERIAGRVGSASATARDLKGIAATLNRFGAVRTGLEQAAAPGLVGEHASDLDDLPEVRSLLDAALTDDPPLVLTEGDIVRDGYNAEVDELRALARHGREILMDIQVRERKRTGIDSLKVQYNSVFGYFIEVPRGKVHLVPEDYQRKQTITTAERYLTPELKEVERKITGAQERLGRLEYEIFLDIRSRVAEHVGSLLKSAKAAGALDAMGGLAEAAARNGYVRPKLDASGAIEIVDGRHPVLERVQSTFVSNDCRLVPGEEQVLIITGPNMAGKSTYLRQVALITLMAHAGSFVPAREAKIPAVDGIYCRIGASDRLAQGLSTFMVEMTEVAHILNHATARSLLIFDEVGRGTSTYDGISIAWAIVEHIVREVKAKTLFATHYYELTSLAERFPVVKNLNVLVREWKNELVFLYKIDAGRADRSYGVQVARLAGLPAPVVTRAKDLLKGFEKSALKEKPVERGDQMSLFEPLPDAVRERLEEVPVESLTPIDAMNLLHELREMLRGGGEDGSDMPNA